jgi:hypothetical protein
MSADDDLAGFVFNLPGLVFGCLPLTTGEIHYAINTNPVMGTHYNIV